MVLSFQNAFLLRMKPSVSRFIEILNVFKYSDKLQFFMYNHEYLNPMRHDDIYLQQKHISFGINVAIV